MRSLEWTGLWRAEELSQGDSTTDPDFDRASGVELKVRDYLGYLYEETKDYPNAILAYIVHNPALERSYFEGHLHLGVLLYPDKQYSRPSTFAEAGRLESQTAEAHCA